MFFWFVFMPANFLLGWIGFGLDEIFFRKYREQEVKAPIFIIGNFRSGSTLLQRLIAKDDRNFTATTTQEIYVTPSITQRKIWDVLSSFDARFLNRTISKLVARFDRRRLNSIPMHRVALHEVDEDEGILLFNWTSSFLMFPFPFMDLFSPYLHFDEENSEKEKKRTMEFYYRMVQKHVYYNGGTRYIAKSPAYSSKVHALREYFPDAKFIYLARNPLDMLASKTSFFSYIWRIFNTTYDPYPYRDMLLELTRSWYLDTLASVEKLPESEYLILRYNELIGELDASIRLIYRHFDMPLTEAFEPVLAQAVEEAASYVSKHKYSLIDMGYMPNEVWENYPEIFERFSFDRRTEELLAELSKKYAEID